MWRKEAVHRQEIGSSKDPALLAHLILLTPYLVPSFPADRLASLSPFYGLLRTKTDQDTPTYLEGEKKNFTQQTSTGKHSSQLTAILRVICSWWFSAPSCSSFVPGTSTHPPDIPRDLSLGHLRTTQRDLFCLDNCRPTVLSP